MIAYSNYLSDARIRREAETLSFTGGYEVTVLALSKGKQGRSYSNGGVVVWELKTAKYQGKSLFRYILSYLKFMGEAFRLSNKLFAKGKVWAIHVHNIPNFLVFAALLPRIRGGKVILDIHDSMPETYLAKFGNRRLLFRILCLEEALSCKFANWIICVNHSQRDILVRRGIDSRKIVISMNVPDPCYFNLQGRDETEKRENPGFKLVYHGTLAKRLGLDLAIEAVARLVHKIPGLEFYVLGSGDDREYFWKVAKALNVDQIVHFPGEIPLEKLRDFLKGMDLGIIANRRNPATELMLPVKMMEYVSLEIPVVVPKLRAIEYYFNGEMVGYFEPENVDSLAEIILSLFRDVSRRKIQAERAKAFLDRYGWENHKFDFLSLYSRLYQSEEKSS